MSAPLTSEQLRIIAHQNQERKICSSVDGANDEPEQLNFDAAIGVVSAEIASKDGPEGRNWHTLPGEDNDDGTCKRYNENAAVHEDAPGLDYREDSIPERNATI